MAIALMLPSARPLIGAFARSERPVHLLVRIVAYIFID